MKPSFRDGLPYQWWKSPSFAMLATTVLCGVAVAASFLVFVMVILAWFQLI